MRNFSNETIDKFLIRNKIGAGQIGSVYLAVDSEKDAVFAIKFISKDNLREGWMNEITKVMKLRVHENVVRYISDGWYTDPLDGAEYRYIVWDYIPSESLSTFLAQGKMQIGLLSNVFVTILKVLHACKIADVEHTDLHSGNILIENENPMNLTPTIRRIFVTDFGYMTAQQNKEYLDDYHALVRILKECLQAINYQDILDSLGRAQYLVLKNIMPKYLLEENRMEGEYVRNPGLLLRLYDDEVQQKLNIDGNKKTYNVGDYLSAELLADQYEEWNRLFVPRFIATDELLDLNISVLTGLRGCGKTMFFRRMSAYMHERLGETGIPQETLFYGFYVNARNITEAFPWLPERHVDNARNRVVNFFHLLWTSEILKWLSMRAQAQHFSITWLNDFLRKYYPEEFITGSGPFESIHDVIGIIERKLTQSTLHSKYESDRWELQDYGYLDNFAKLILENVPGLDRNRKLFFFLDDYSTPTVFSSLQKILNGVVFRRSSFCLFKVSTESVESFEPIGLNGKKLEEGNDYKLIDCGTLSLQIDEQVREGVLTEILERRIARNPKYDGLNLLELLGKCGRSENEKARILKEGRQRERSSLYYGVDTLGRMWSSDIREMINIFAQMLSRQEDKLDLSRRPVIEESVQESVVVDDGGRFMALLQSVTNPSKPKEAAVDGKNYGKALTSIVKGFRDMCVYDLRNQEIKNQNSLNPKQARRIEIKELSELEGIDYDYYRGLIRYGIFIRDTRAKSVDNRIATRLVLRSSLIPYFGLTFSKKDSITLSWEDFLRLLRTPEDLARTYTSAKSVKGEGVTQVYMEELLRGEGQYE